MTTMVDTELQKRIQQFEDEAADRGGQPIPKGYYKNEISEKNSEIKETKYGQPWLSIARSIVEDGNVGEDHRSQVGRYVRSGGLFIFPSPNPMPNKKTGEIASAEERMKSSVGRAMTHLMGYVHQLVGRDDVDPALAPALLDEYAKLTKLGTEDYEEGREIFQNILNILDGEVFIDYVGERPYWNNDADKAAGKDPDAIYNDAEPFVWGTKKNPERQAQSWQKGLERAGLAGNDEVV